MLVLHQIYQAASQHAQENTKCAHFGCAAVTHDNEFVVVTNNKHRHAEMEALEQMKNVMDLFLVRLRKDGTPAMSKPCVDCLFVIKQRGIRNVHYTNEQGTMVTERAHDMVSTHRSKIKIIT